MEQKFSRPMVFLIVLLSLISGCIGGERQVDLEDMAKEHAGYLSSGQYEKFFNSFDEDMKGEISLEELESLWSEVVETYGEPGDIEDISIENDGEYTIVDMTYAFSKGESGVLRIVYDSDCMISGFWISEVSGYELPPYADQSAYTEVEVEVVSGDYVLSGILTMPLGDGPFPGVVLVHGSGANDMDETIGPNKPFKDIATGLASQGVAVLRYDKRTYAYSIGINEILGFTVMEETVYDALAAIETLKAVEGVDPESIYVIGHSLGGMMAPRIASMTDELAGIVVMSGNARALEELIVEQIWYISNYDGVIDDGEMATIEQVTEMALRISELDIGEGEIVLGAARAYWEDLSTYDQVEVARGLDTPILVVQGERDYQVTMEDFQLWEYGLSGKENATFISYPGLNHLMMYGEDRSIGTEYYIEGHVDEGLINDIHEWIGGIA
ncbi:MAG TPA: alpha/beta fold hydrolase [Candidatus Methanofastidiosa archaeon]|nr:alpha/beta fold hydrolase [Candidatus Methanofastidiosa archaeon]